MPRSSEGKPKARTYTGDLAEPIYEPVLWASISDGLEERKRRAEQRASERQLAKLIRLFDWYKINTAADDQWARLALALAKAHVRGMQVIYEGKPKRGPKRKWNEGLYEQLLQDVNEIRKTKKLAITEAIKVLRDDPTGAFYKSDPNSLNARYREAVREHKKRRLIAEKLKLRTIPNLVNLGSPSGSLFAIVKWDPLPSKIPFKRISTE